MQTKNQSIPEYPWYGIITNEDHLAQGDFIFSCPILEPIHDVVQDKITANYSEYDVIIMSQTCDLINNKLTNVLVCPFWKLSEIENKFTWFKSKKNKEKLRKGNQPNYHLLNKSNTPEFQFSHIVVDFRDVFSVPFNYLIENIKDTQSRLRLLSPYKEHLAQAFARFFMRVGLPVDIQPFI
ncbi:MAG: hypothetical protein ACTSRK_14120 [Promethearchaeota archaeon]